MYAVDMCIEFQQKSDGLLYIDWIEHITTETCAVFAKIFPNKFREPQKKQVKISVRQLMQMPATALKQVNYYLIDNVYDKCIIQKYKFRINYKNISPTLGFRKRVVWAMSIYKGGNMLIRSLK